MDSAAQEYYMYILYSEGRDRYYVGSRDNIDRRFKEHNSGKSKSTRSGRPWLLVYTEHYHTLSQALKKEYAIKRKKRRFYIEWLIKNQPGSQEFGL